MAESLGPVGFVGLGSIGTGLASAMQAWPEGLVVCDVNPDAVAPFAERGATVATTPAEVAEAGATVISVVVLTDQQVRDVVVGPGGIAETATPGTVVAIHSTVSPDTPGQLAEEVADRGISILDAPVTGGLFAAYEGKVALMLGGDAEAVERCRPVFEVMSGLIVHAGPLGAATRLKVARNLLTFVGYAAAGEATRIAEAAGLNLRDLAAVIDHSERLIGGPAAIMHRDDTAVLAPDDGLRGPFEHARDLGEKDLRLALDLAADLDVDAPFSRLALERLADSLGVPHDA